MHVHKLPSRFRGRFGIARHKRQLKHFHARETPWGIAQHREHQVIHTFFHTIHQLCRGAATAHRGQCDAAHPALALGSDFVAPRRDQLFHGQGSLGPVVLKIQRNFRFGGRNLRKST